MCSPALAVAGVSAAASLGGMYMSNQAQQRQAKSIGAQNAAMQAAQNSAFFERMNSARRQSDAQYATMQQGIEDQKAAADRMRASQNMAIEHRQELLAATNAQAEALRARGDTAAADLLERTNLEALDRAQDARVDQSQLLLDQSGAVPGGSVPEGPSAADPGASGTSTETDGAVARRMAQAATNIREYGQKLAKTASYGQPMNTVGLATADNRTGIMPMQVADKLLSSGTPIRLLPTQLAYRNAGDFGQAETGAIQRNTQAHLDIAGLDYGNSTAAANLGQQNAGVAAANTAAQAKQDALWGQQMGGILSGLGNLGMYGAGYYGGGPEWLKPSVPGAPKIT
jgi:hypothetical protein